MYEIISNSITGYLDILKSIFYWILAFSLVTGYGLYNGNKSIKYASFEIETKDAYNLILGFYFVINLVLLLIFFRINELLVNFLPKNNIDKDLVFLTVKTYPWILNPFADYSHYKNAHDLAQNIKGIDSWVNYFSSGLGCFSLMLIWFGAFLVLKFTRGSIRSYWVKATETLLLLLLLILIAIIFLILENIQYQEPIPYGLGFIFGLIFGIFSFLFIHRSFLKNNGNP